MTTDLNMVRIYISEARGMCTDGLPLEQIDVVLGLALDKLDVAALHWELSPEHTNNEGENNGG